MPERHLMHELKIAIEKNKVLTLKLICFLLLGLLANLLTPWPMKFLFDNILNLKDIGPITNGPFDFSGYKISAIMFFSLISFCLVAGRGFCNRLRHVFITQFANFASDDLRSKVFAHFLKIETSELALVDPDDLRARLSEDVDRIRDCFVEVIAVVAGEFLMLIFTLAILFEVDLPFASVSTVFIALLFLVYRWMPISIDRQSSISRILEAKRSGFLSDRVRSQFFIRAWNREENEKSKLQELDFECAEVSLKKAKSEGNLIFAVEILTALLTAVVLGFGGYRVLAGKISVGDLVLFLQYLGFLYAPIGRTSSFFLIYQRGKTSWKRVLEFLSMKQETQLELIHPKISQETVYSRELEIRFEQVSFAYPDSPILFKNLNFTLRAGEIAALTGASGIGKSTILKLIMGFYQPTAGRIFLGEKPIAQIPIQELRRRIAYVDQEALLFSGTLKDNLIYANQAIDLQQFEEVCRRLEIDSFANLLPNKWLTPVVAGNSLFSAGQKQRIALARALLSDRPVILMDEPTASMDSALEERLIEQFSDLLRGRTVVLVSHRPQPLKLASQRLALSFVANRQAAMVDM